MKDILTHIGVAALAVLLFYLLFYLPDIKKARQEYQGQIDTTYAVGKDSTTERDTSLSAVKPVAVKPVKPDSSVISLVSSMDTSIVSGRDTLNWQTTVNIKVSRDSLLNFTFDITDLVAQWFTKLKHIDYTPLPDTIKIGYPVMKEVTVDVSWYRTDTFAYIVSGVVYVATLLSIIFFQ